MVSFKLTNLTRLHSKVDVDKHLIVVIYAYEELDAVVLLLVDSLLILDAIHDALNIGDVVSKTICNLNVVLLSRQRARHLFPRHLSEL